MNKGAREPKTFTRHLSYLQPSNPPMTSITPLTKDVNDGPCLRPLDPARRTMIMSILNLTPDSFSDGGIHNADNSFSLLRTLNQHVKSGASIVDIGAQSTRPHAPQISAEEEISRLKHTLDILSRNSSCFFPDDPSTEARTITSLDTYRSSVFTAALSHSTDTPNSDPSKKPSPIDTIHDVAAALSHSTHALGSNSRRKPPLIDIINDISAGTLDPLILPTIAKSGHTCILMHTRGTPSTMNKLASYPSGLIPTLASELLSRIAAAESAGIRRWRIILDPGIGFAKNHDQNLELLRRFPELRQWEGLRGMPWLVGVSRKGFIGRLTGVKEAGERKFGTAGAVSAAVWGGADIVRVHDVGEMSEVVKVADGIWRGPEVGGGNMY